MIKRLHTEYLINPGDIWDFYLNLRYRFDLLS